MLWATALLGAVASAATWPVVESYLSAGRHGAAMRSAIGWFNVVWTPATAVPLLIMPVVARVDLLGTIALSALFNAGAMLALIKLPPRPPEHAAEASHAAVGPEYPALLRSASWLLPLSYLISSNLAPILPHRLAGLDSVVPGQRDRRQLDGGPVPVPGGDVAAGVLARALGHVAAGGGGAGRRAGAWCCWRRAWAVWWPACCCSGPAPGSSTTPRSTTRWRWGTPRSRRAGTSKRSIGLGYCLGPLLGLGGQLLSGGDPARARTATVALVWTAAAGIGLAALRPYAAVRRSRNRQDLAAGQLRRTASR